MTTMFGRLSKGGRWYKIGHNPENKTAEPLAETPLTN
jgi:hypothetical protein